MASKPSGAPALCRASTSFIRYLMQDVDGRNKPGHDENLNCGNFNDQVGQPFGGIGRAAAFGRLRHLRKPRRIIRQRRDFSGQALGREVPLLDADRSARGLE